MCVCLLFNEMCSGPRLRAESKLASSYYAKMAFGSGYGRARKNDKEKPLSEKLSGLDLKLGIPHSRSPATLVVLAGTSPPSSFAGRPGCQG